MSYDSQELSDFQNALAHPATAAALRIARLVPHGSGMAGGAGTIHPLARRGGACYPPRMKWLVQRPLAQALLTSLMGRYLAFALRTTHWTIDGAEHLAPHVAGAPCVAAFW